MHHHQPVIDWSPKDFLRKPICFRLLSPTSAYAAVKAADGYKRPYGSPHLWSSGRIGGVEWLEASWSEAQVIGQVHVTFNDDVNEDLINLHHHRTEFEIIPELVKDYKLQAWIGEAWSTIAERLNNHTRHHVHVLNSSVSTNRLRVVVESTNGSARAEIVELRCYR